MDSSHPRLLSHLIFGLVLVLGAGPVWAQPPTGGPTGPNNGARAEQIKQRRERLRNAIDVHRRHVRDLMGRTGVVASGVSIDQDGEPAIKVYTDRLRERGIPDSLDGVRVRSEVSGKFYALLREGTTCESSGDNVCQTTERWPLPVPIGVSVGHPAITAGTIGARVTDGSNVFFLSNNHVLANANQAAPGDLILQPGSFDGGNANNDAIGYLSGYEEIHFCTVFLIWLICDQTNTIDAALATPYIDTSDDLYVGVSTPTGDYGSDEGYGTPSTTLHPAYGNPATIGDEDMAALLGVQVQKFGRTTELTTGDIDTVNATVNVCYDSNCSLIAQFTDQIIVTPGTFSAGGDSGSLIVDMQRRPVGLLFAGSDTNTIANRIDLVLNRFGVTIDDGGGTPSTPDLAISAIGVPSTVVAREETTVTVTVENVGNQTVQGATVSLVDFVDSTETNAVTTSPITGGIGAGSSSFEFTWMPTEEGQHTLKATVLLDGDTDPSNDTLTSSVQVVSSLPSGPQLELREIWASTDDWETVSLANDYGNEMVVVCTPKYDGFVLGPTVVRVRNAVGSSFDVGLARPWYGALPGDRWSTYLHCMVVRKGVYTEDEHGVKMEAFKFEVTTTDHKGSWIGSQRTYDNSYSAPVVVGQVMSAARTKPGEIGDWSVFWSRGSRSNQPPSTTQLWVGRHTGEDPGSRPAETVGYVVIEHGTGTMDGVAYEAGLGPDSVRGVENAPPYSYALTGSVSPTWGILSQAGMDGGDGGWPVLYGANALSTGAVNMAIEEDWYWDSERRHTAEQVGYIVFE